MNLTKLMSPEARRRHEERRARFERKQRETAEVSNEELLRRFEYFLKNAQFRLETAPTGLTTTTRSFSTFRCPSCSSGSGR